MVNMYYFLMLLKKMSIESLRTSIERLDEFSRRGISIPDELRQEIDRIKQNINAFLRASQEEFDSKEKNESQEQMIFFLWRTFYNNVIEKNDDFYKHNFKLYGTPLFNEKDYGKTVIATDIREKIRAIHEMLINSWPHMVPPQIKDIDFKGSLLKNNMIYESPGEYGIEEIPPAYGFDKPPSLKKDAQPLSIEKYLETEYRTVERINHNHVVLDFAEFARDPDSQFYDPRECYPTFLSDVMERHGSKRYPDICRMFPNCLSDYHPRE